MIGYDTVTCAFDLDALGKSSDLVELDRSDDNY